MCSTELAGANQKPNVDETKSRCITNITVTVHSSCSNNDYSYVLLSILISILTLTVAIIIKLTSSAIAATINADNVVVVCSPNITSTLVVISVDSASAITTIVTCTSIMSLTRVVLLRNIDRAPCFRSDGRTPQKWWSP